MHRGPLTDFVAEAGLRWMVVGQPARIARDPELGPALRPLIPKSGLEAFRNSTGIDLTKTSSALVAGFDYATLYAATATASHAAIERRFIERTVAGAIRREPRPDLSFISGVVGTAPETLVSVDRQLVAVAVGDPTPARVVAAFALGRLKRALPALRGAALATLPANLEQAPVRFYAPGPLPPAWAHGAHGLLATAQAVGASAEPGPGGTLQVRLVLSGDFAHRGPEARQRLLATWKDLSDSDLGRLLGLSRPTDGPTVSLQPRTLELRVTLDLARLVEGLRAAVSDNVQQMLRMGNGPPPPPRGTDKIK